jgi:hypothetical protein
VETEQIEQERDVVRPLEKRFFVVGRREPGQLDDLVDADLAGVERCGDRGKRSQLGARRHPALGFPARDVELHRYPLRHVVRAVVQPGLVPLQLGQAVEHLALRSRSDALELVDARDQRRSRLGT